MKKGRHRRFEEARILKRSINDSTLKGNSKETEKCAECNAVAGTLHASWCSLKEQKNL